MIFCLISLIDLFQKCCWESDIKLLKTTCSSSRVQKRVVLLVIWLFFCVYDLLSWLSLTRQMAIPAITKAISVVCIVLWAPLVYRPVGRYQNPGGGCNVVGIICPLFEIGLAYLPKYVEVIAPSDTLVSDGPGLLRFLSSPWVQGVRRSLFANPPEHMGTGGIVLTMFWQNFHLSHSFDPTDLPRFV